MTFGLLCEIDVARGWPPTALMPAAYCTRQGRISAALDASLAAAIVAPLGWTHALRVPGSRP
jgi:hypothetical protein